MGEAGPELPAIHHWVTPCDCNVTFDMNKIFTLIKIRRDSLLVLVILVTAHALIATLADVVLLLDRALRDSSKLQHKSIMREHVVVLNDQRRVLKWARHCKTSGGVMIVLPAIPTCQVPKIRGALLFCGMIFASIVAVQDDARNCLTGRQSSLQLPAKASSITLGLRERVQVANAGEIGKHLLQFAFVEVHEH